MDRHIKPVSFSVSIILVILKLPLIFSGVIFLSDEDTLPSWERNVFIDVNTMTSSSEHVCTDDIERLEHHSPLTIDCQYNEGSGATWKSSSIPNNTKLENLHRDETAEGPFHLNPSQADER